MTTYKDAIDWAQDNRPYNVTLIHQLGKPCADESVPTAAVRAAQRDSADKWEFAYNPTFFEGLSNAEAIGVMTHEVYHVLCHHLPEMVDNLTKTPKPYENHQKMIMAQECIVNDNVINDGHDLPDGVIIGYEQLGFDTSSYSTREVYDLIPDDHGMMQDSEQGQPCDMGSLSDEEIQGLADAISKAIGEMTDDEVASIAPAQKDKDEQESSVKKAGTEFEGSNVYAQKMDVSENWVNFLKKVHPDFLEGYGIHGKLRTTWSVPRKKFTYMYPKVVLPNKLTVGDNLKRDGGMKPHIVLALDFSGSIDRSMTKKMAKLARSIPNSIDVDCCTFSTEFVPFDHTKDDNETAGGGTSFSAVERFVRSLDSKSYPKAVVVFTDGGATFDSYYGTPAKPTADQLFNNWYWVAVGSGDREYIKHYVPGCDHGKIFDLKDLF